MKQEIQTVQVGQYRVGQDEPLLVIAGPCVLESDELALEIAVHLQSIASRHPIQLIFKASFDKANRTSLKSHRGPGLDAGLEMLDQIRSKTGLPTTTDIHEPNQAEAASAVCEMLQIPAFLARQTDLLVAAARTNAAVNVKKGQFMSPTSMRHVVTKLNESGCDNVLLCERGTFFGYSQLVNDMTALVEMRQLGTPVVFDATHSVQQPSGAEGVTKGNREMVAPLARAAAAVGIDGLFFETHPTPDRSPSDGPNLVPLSAAESLIEQVVAIRKTSHKYVNCIGSDSS